MPTDDIGAYRWEGFTLAEKYGWMQTGEGPDAVRPAVEALRVLSDDFATSHRILRAELAKLQVSWQGWSAEAAAGSMTELADWVAGAGRNAAQGGGGLNAYGASFAALRPRIPPPSGPGSAPDAAAGGYHALAGLQTEYRKHQQVSAAADAQANVALTEHHRATRAALDAFPAAVPPPTVVADAGSTSFEPTPAAPPGAVPSPAATTPATAAPAATVSAAAPAMPSPSAATASARDYGWIPVGPAGAGPPAGPPPGHPAGPPPGHPAGPPPGHPAGPSPGHPADRRTSAGNVPPPNVPSPHAPGPRGRSAVGEVVAGAAARSASSEMGIPPELSAGYGSGEPHRRRRNEVFIPSDEPFRVEFRDVTPPVLGRSEDAW